MNDNFDHKSSSGDLSESLLGPGHEQMPAWTVRGGGGGDEEQVPAELQTPLNASAADATASATSAAAATVDYTEADAVVAAGNAQPRALRDAWAAVLFLAKQGVVLYLAVAWGWPHWSDSSAAADDKNQADVPPPPLPTNYVAYGHTAVVVLLSGVAAALLGLVLLQVMVRVARSLVAGALVVAVAVQVGSALYLAVLAATGGGSSSGSGTSRTVNLAGAGTSLAMAAATALYAQAVWRRLPLAAAQLTTALTAVQTCGSVVLVAVAVTVALVAWTAAVWMAAVWGVYWRTVRCVAGAHDDAAAAAAADADDASTTTTCTAHFHGGLFVLLLLSLFWTIQVSQNVVHVTVSGTVGTWWFCPHESADRYWAVAVRDSARRACTYSLGSICLGSLLTACLQALDAAVRMARGAHDGRRGAASRTTGAGGGGGVVLCVAQCAARCTGRLLAYFHKWAYVYVALYGYDYLTAGSKVMTLFRERGWTTIVQDDLIQRVLQLASLALGVLTAALAVGLQAATTTANHKDDDDGSGSNNNDKTTAAALFALALATGTAVGHVVFGVVSSAVDTCLVAWAEAPVELERHHPGLYAAQVAAWRTAHPQESLAM